MASFSNERTNAHFQDITTDLDLMLPVKTGESEAEADMIEIDFVIDEDKYEKVWTWHILLGKKPQLGLCNAKPTPWLPPGSVSPYLCTFVTKLD